jgi:16S rRNA (guanine966-N2)-methyltransferase
MRIVAGTLRGRPIITPEHGGLRPTADRVRESVFNILAHGIKGFELAGARVVDMFAGTGALGLEALSRGAAFCVFVEDDADARAIIRRNVEAFGLTGQTRIFRRDATDLGNAGDRDVANLMFLDPPYGKGLAAKALASAVKGNWFAPGAVIVCEERAGEPLDAPAALIQFDKRTYGDTQIVFLRNGASGS